LGQLINNSFFKITKTGLALALKVLTNRAAQVLLDDMVGVRKRNLKTPRQLAPDCGFT
jgi:hypothetical protein